MTAKVILLSSDSEASFLKKALAPHIKNCTIAIAHNISQLDTIAQKGDRLISFLSPFIVPEKILKRLQYNCYNFHPASPDYPGYQPASFAIYENKMNFGATFHQMFKKIDSGPIIKVNYFKIKKEWNYIDLSKESFIASVKLFIELAPLIANINFSFKENGKEWGHNKYTSKDYDTKRCIPSDTSFVEIERRFKAFEGIFSSLEKDNPC